MKGEMTVITKLNECLAASLTAINQYFIHSEMCRDWGYDELYERFRKESIRAMVRAEKLIRRILYLDGRPNMSEYLRIKVGETVEKQLVNDLNLELDILRRLEKAVQVTTDTADDGSRELVEMMVREEEEYVDWLEAQNDLIKAVGIGKYLSQQIYE